ncbi:Uncharacterised protein [Escherichia coli]|uniref:Uncharacterized protein n=1 Tax=Escherichia coli TaxID=562 RepID=A0A377CWD9_ECOLX|nr:Uncharacterised protein [Escherichia coli]
MSSSLMDNLICALMGNGRPLIVGKAFDLLQTSRISIVMVGANRTFSFPHPLPAQLSGKTISQRRACG